ncbi:hypothetical protein BDD12DRAFT_911207 [Trichophaea hybrida]|nr:hypothetical protein BDD12DRAFT_911207 [Trichophaea hybrida]
MLRLIRSLLQDAVPVASSTPHFGKFRVMNYGRVQICHSKVLPGVRQMSGRDFPKPTEPALANGTSRDGADNRAANTMVGNKDAADNCSAVFSARDKGNHKNYGAYKNASCNDGASKDAAHNDGVGKGGDRTNKDGAGKNGTGKDGAGKPGAWNYLSWKSLAVGSAGCLAGGVIYAYWYDNNRDILIYAALQKRSVPATTDFIERPEAWKQVTQALTSAPTKYDVIIGYHGTGKSTLIREIAGEIPGIVYVLIPPCKPGKCEELLTAAFKEALNRQEPGISYAKMMWNNIMGRQLYKPDDISTTNWRRVFKDFGHAATKFKAQHSRNAVLVFDNINVIAEADKELLAVLQGYAKIAADLGLFKVVFVCSDGVAPFQMRSNSAWSRADSECRIGDLTSSEALDYLIKKRHIDPGDAQMMVQTCGCRILTLKHVCDALQRGFTLDDFLMLKKSEEFSRFQAVALLIGTERADKIAATVLRHGTILEKEYWKLCGDHNTGQLFLSFNIFAIRGRVQRKGVLYNVFGFENEIVKAAIREQLEEGSEAELTMREGV